MRFGQLNLGLIFNSDCSDNKIKEAVLNFPEQQFSAKCFYIIKERDGKLLFTEKHRIERVYVQK